MGERAGFGAEMAALSAEVAAGRGASAERFRAALDAVLARGDPACVPALIGLLDDGSPAPHLMGALMHAAEGFPVAPYLDGLVRALPALDRRAPGWADRLARSALNGVLHRPALAARLRDCPDATVAAVRRVLARVAARDPELFGGKAYEVVSALPDPPADG